MMQQECVSLRDSSTTQVCVSLRDFWSAERERKLPRVREPPRVRGSPGAKVAAREQVRLSGRGSLPEGARVTEATEERPGRGTPWLREGRGEDRLRNARAKRSRSARDRGTQECEKVMECYGAAVRARIWAELRTLYWQCAESRAQGCSEAVTMCAFIIYGQYQVCEGIVQLLYMWILCRLYSY